MCATTAIKGVVKLDSQEVKRMFKSLGADLCGIASIERFDGSPKDYHPVDVLPSCKSVISFGCRFPVGTLFCQTSSPYTRVRNTITPKMDRMALDFCVEMEKNGILAIPIPTNESEFDSNTGRWRSIVSLKHAAQAAGLGTIGRHSLLITPEFGSMIWLGAVLTEGVLEPDALKEKVCNDCNLCVEICPINALEKPEIKQSNCWNYAFGNDPEKKEWRISCHKCRDVCPFNFGTENKIFKREVNY
jgi:epoxyqueuosine reductase QueG